MSTSTNLPATAVATGTASRTWLVPLTAAVAVVAVLATIWGADSRPEMMYVLAGNAVVAAFVYGRLMPRQLERPQPGVAVTLSAIAAATVLPAFWTALPVVLGAAGVVLGEVGRRRTGNVAASSVAIALGALAILGYLAIYISEIVANGIASFGHIV